MAYMDNKEEVIRFLLELGADIQGLEPVRLTEIQRFTHKPTQNNHLHEYCIESVHSIVCSSSRRKVRVSEEIGGRFGRGCQLRRPCKQTAISSTPHTYFIFH